MEDNSLPAIDRVGILHFIVTSFAHPGKFQFTFVCLIKSTKKREKLENSILLAVE